MDIEIMVDADGTAACFVCPIQDLAFGPVARGAQAAEQLLAFGDWLGADPRHYLPHRLDMLWSTFSAELESDTGMFAAADPAVTAPGSVPGEDVSDDDLAAGGLEPAGELDVAAEVAAAVAGAEPDRPYDARDCWSCQGSCVEEDGSDCIICAARGWVVPPPSVITGNTPSV